MRVYGLELGNNEDIKFGNLDELQIYFDGSYGRILSATSIIIETVTPGDDIRLNSAGQVFAAYEGNDRFRTTSVGIQLSSDGLNWSGHLEPYETSPSGSIPLAYNGYFYATRFYGSGAGLTSIPAAELTGTIEGARGVTAGSATDSFLRYNGTTKYGGRLYGGTDSPDATTRLNYDGYFYATRFYGNGDNLTDLDASNLTSGTVDSARGVIAGSVTASFVRYNGQTAGVSGSFYGGTTDPTATTRLNYEGNFHAHNFYGLGSGLTNIPAAELTGTVAGARGVRAGDAIDSFLRYYNNTRAHGYLYGGTTDPISSDRLNYDGYFYATRFYGDGSQLTNLPDTAHVGTLLLWPMGGTPPTHYLECNGASLDRLIYSELFDLLGTYYGAADGSHFNIPDYRGYFLRSWSHGRNGIDPDKADRDATSKPGHSMSDGNWVGTEQGDAIQDHRHYAGYGAYDGVSGPALVAADNGPDLETKYMSSGNISTETRSKNIYVMVCIKYE